MSNNRVILISRQPTGDGGWVATYEDVTERRRAEERIVFMARHDVLTGLPNRVLFAERIENAISQLGRNSSGFAVLNLDLDHFKQVNDTLGHPVGDELLRSVAERLKACVREVDTVSRLGGDEFAILQSDIQKPEEAALLARRIVEVLSAPYDIDGHRLTISVSVGISIAPGDGTAYDKLLKNADVALYLAKADGRATWRFFEPEMDVRLQVRRALELDLRDALGNSEFEVHYQPVFDLQENRIGGFEALLRWNHPTRGQVSPADFISLAEEIGLIVPLGEWVLRTACAEAATWPNYIKLAVNVSVAQFKSAHFLQIGDRLRARLGLSPRRLELEITESLLLTNNDRDARQTASIARFRRPHRDGRLRHWLFVAELSAQLPLRQDQDRSVLRQRHDEQGRFAGHRQGDDSDGEQSWHPRHSRGRRDTGTTRLAARGGLRRSARLSVQPRPSRSPTSRPHSPVERRKARGGLASTRLTRRPSTHAARPCYGRSL